MYIVIWEYRVRPGEAARFEALHGAQGEWAALFRAWPGYRATELLRREDDRYVTLDRWDSREAYERFQEEAREEYARIDAIGDALTLEERRVGAYTLAPP
jgi:heme-degrading monooxygenase HmoA